jgi:hypothetical protein
MVESFFEKVCKEEIFEIVFKFLKAEDILSGDGLDICKKLHARYLFRGRMEYLEQYDPDEWVKQGYPRISVKEFQVQNDINEAHIKELENELLKCNYMIVGPADNTLFTKWYLRKWEL